MQVPSFSWLYLGDMTEWEENLLDFKRPSSFSEVSHIEGKKKRYAPKYFLNRYIEKIEQPCNHFLINILYYNGTFVTTNETTLMKYY